MSGDNFRREVGKLRRRIGVKRSETEHSCPMCGQSLRGARHARLIQAHYEEMAKEVKEQLIQTVEDMAARQREAQERRDREQAEGRGHYHEQGDYRGGQMASASVQDVEGTDAREHHERREQGGRDHCEQREQQLDEQDSYDAELERRVFERVGRQDDPVLKILRERREKRRLEREHARRAVRPTVVNNGGGQEDEGDR